MSVSLTTRMMRYSTGNLRISRAAPLFTAVLNKGLCTSSSACSPPRLYELRMYTLQPKHFKATLDLFEKKADLRLQYSKLFGYWTAEIGQSPTQYVHIWEYDSLSHRRQVRNSLAADDAWKSEFLSTILNNVAEWKNVLMVPCPGTDIDVNFERNNSAVYLLETAKKTGMQRGGLEEPVTGEHVVGRFQGIMGPTNVEYTLKRFQNIDDATISAQKKANEIDGSIMLLNPTNFSPIH